RGGGGQGPRRRAAGGSFATVGLRGRFGGKSAAFAGGNIRDAARPLQTWRERNTQTQIEERRGEKPKSRTPGRTLQTEYHSRGWRVRERRSMGAVQRSSYLRIRCARIS